MIVVPSSDFPAGIGCLMDKSKLQNDSQEVTHQNAMTGERRMMILVQDGLLLAAKVSHFILSRACLRKKR